MEQNFKDISVDLEVVTISDAPMSILWAAVMVDDVVYYSVDSYGDTALYSYTPGMPEAEARETGLSGKFGLRLDGRTLRLVQTGRPCSPRSCGSTPALRDGLVRV